jgi:hypothetical protein
MRKLILCVVGGGLAGALLGYVNQCAGGTCPLLCLWWRGALFGAGAGLLIYLAGRSDRSQGEAKDRCAAQPCAKPREVGVSPDQKPPECPTGGMSV